MAESSPARMLRLAVSGVLMLVLVAAATASCTRNDRTLVPPVLAGRWKGGAHSNGPWYYEFTLDGRYRARSARGPTPANTGTVRVDAATITFSNAGAPVTETWTVSRGVLVLDGTRYTRA